VLEVVAILFALNLIVEKMITRTWRDRERVWVVSGYI
jgi:hypothetical protein